MRAICFEYDMYPNSKGYLPITGVYFSFDWEVKRLCSESVVSKFILCYNDTDPSHVHTDASYYDYKRYETTDTNTKYLLVKCELEEYNVCGNYMYIGVVTGMDGDYTLCEEPKCLFNFKTMLYTRKTSGSQTIPLSTFINNALYPLEGPLTFSQYNPGIQVAYDSSINTIGNSVSIIDEDPEPTNFLLFCHGMFKAWQIYIDYELIWETDSSGLKHLKSIRIIFSGIKNTTHHILFQNRKKYSTYNIDDKTAINDVNVVIQKQPTGSTYPPSYTNLYGYINPSNNTKDTSSTVPSWLKQPYLLDTILYKPADHPNTTAVENLMSNIPDHKDTTVGLLVTFSQHVKLGSSDFVVGHRVIVKDFEKKIFGSASQFNERSVINGYSLSSDSYYGIMYCGTFTSSLEILLSNVENLQSKSSL